MHIHYILHTISTIWLSHLGANIMSEEPQDLIDSAEVNTFYLRRAEWRS